MNDKKKDDETCRLVLELISMLTRPPYEPVGPSPVYQEFERLTRRTT